MKTSITASHKKLSDEELDWYIDVSPSGSELQVANNDMDLIRLNRGLRLALVHSLRFFGVEETIRALCDMGHSSEVVFSIEE